MKRFLSLFLTLTLVFSLAACAVPASKSGTSTDPPVTSELQGTVVFADPVLEAMVRGTIGKPEGDITAVEAAAVTRLVLSSEWEQHSSEWTPIKDLSGLEYFTSLESLDLSGHSITDITPLAGLSKLTILVLSGNPITDISPLAGLTSLRTLLLSGCKALDYSQLANLTSLEYLALDNSMMIDATPLASLTNLRRLYLEGCELDYTPFDGYLPESRR